MNDSSYTTENEVNFLKNLGHWSRTTQLTRKECLQLYFHTMATRDQWGDIKPSKLVDVVKRMIREEV
jgi:hypothetical protein